MPKSDSDVLATVVDKVNAEARQSLLKQLDPRHYLMDQQAQKRAGGLPNLKQSDRMEIATITTEMETFLKETYGEDFWRDASFWKAHPEYLAINPIDLPKNL